MHLNGWRRASRTRSWGGGRGVAERQYGWRLGIRRRWMLFQTVHLDPLLHTRNLDLLRWLWRTPSRRAANILRLCLFHRCCVVAQLKLTKHFLQSNDAASRDRMLLRRQHVRRSQRCLQLLLRPADLGRCEVRTRPSSASLGLTDYSHVGMRGSLYKFVTLQRNRAWARQLCAQIH